MGSLRVLIVGLNYSPERTGNAPYTAGLARAIAAAGHEVRVITTHPHYPDWAIADGYGEWRRIELIDNVPVTRLRHFVPRKPTGLLRLLSELSFGVRAVLSRWDKPDVIIMPSPALFSTAVVSLRARVLNRSARRVMWVQDLYTLGMEETGRGSFVKVMQWLESWTARGNHGVAAIHPRFRDLVIGRLGVPPDRVKVVRNWSHVQPTGVFDRVMTRRRYGWGDNETIALHAGNMGVKQGLENLVAMARLADTRAEPVRVVLVGGGSQKASLVAQADGIERIQWLDSLPDGDFEQVLASADVLLLNEKPGVAELAVPSKLTTYFSSGVPVVAATDEGSISASEIEASGGGVRVTAGEPGALLDAILSLRSDPETARQLGAAGVTFRDTYLTEEAAIGSYLGWLESLVAQPRKTRTV